MIRLGHSLRLTDRQGSGGVFVLTPPTLAPILSVYADPDSPDAELLWTASNKTGSSGFGYKIEISESGANIWNEVVTNLTALTYTHAPGDGTWDYRVTPFNSAGEGPVSNVASVVLPGESEESVTWDNSTHRFDTNLITFDRN